MHKPVLCLAECTCQSVMCMRVCRCYSDAPAIHVRSSSFGVGVVYGIPPPRRPLSLYFLRALYGQEHALTDNQCTECIVAEIASADVCPTTKKPLAVKTKPKKKTATTTKKKKKKTAKKKK